MLILAAGLLSGAVWYDPLGVYHRNAKVTGKVERSQSGFSVRQTSHVVWYSSGTCKGNFAVHEEM